MKLINKESEKFVAQETLPAILLLAMNSGFIDGNTFLYNDGRFAGMQTGNIIQAGIALAQGNFGTTMKFIWPVIAFIFGIFLNTYIKRLFKNHPIIRFEQISLIIESLGILVFVLLQGKINSTLAISGLSFFLALQVDTFAKLHGKPVATVFNTGNTKSFGINLFNGIIDRDKKTLITAFEYFLVILAFLFGPFIATILHNYLGVYTLIFSPLILLAVLGHITFHRNK
jgi:uncharacterized membrane protein YoaK (UPF0700 family)